jgi:hypothetical protein
MKKYLLLLSMLSCMAYSQTSKEPERIQKRLSANVTFFQEISMDPPLAVQGLRIKPGERIHLQAVLGGDQVQIENPARGREATSRAAWRHRALAAINADFFPFSGDPLGLCIINGELVSEPFPNRPALGWAGSRVVLGAPTLNADVTRADGQKNPLTGVNRSATAGELVLSTNFFGAVARSEVKGVAVVLDALERPLSVGRTVKAVVREVLADVNSAPIPFAGGVLFGSDAAGEFLSGIQPGDTIRIRLDLLNEKGEQPSSRWRGIQEAVAGGPWIVQGGKPVGKESFESAGFNTGFWNQRHPRAAMGLTDKGEMLWVAVDGRQPHSRGATLPELADLMIKLGATQAINLDGGGSTTLVVQNVVVNSPSDGSERPVANLMLLHDESLRALATPQPYSINPPSAILKVGETVQFRVMLDGKPVSTWNAVWGANGVGFVDQWGRLTAIRAGTGMVSAYVDGLWLHAMVKVEAPLVAAPDKKQ